MTEWTAILDRLERQVQRQERALASGDDLPGILALDSPEVRMTADERVRATALMQRTDQLIGATIATMRTQKRPESTPYA